MAEWTKDGGLKHGHEVDIEFVRAVHDRDRRKVRGFRAGAKEKKKMRAGAKERVFFTHHDSCGF